MKSNRDRLISRPWLAASLVGGLLLVQLSQGWAAQPPNWLVDGAFNARFEQSAAVNLAVPQPDGKILVAGPFHSLNSQTRAGLARLNADGSTDTDFQFSVPPGFLILQWEVQSLAVQTNGPVLVGGRIMIYDSSFLSRWQGVVRLLPNGALDTNFMAGLELGGEPLALALDGEGRVLVAGSGIATNGASAEPEAVYPNLVRLLSNGLPDPTFNPGAGANAPIRCLAILGNGKILAAGDFTQFNGAAVGRLCRLETSGALDPSFSVSQPDGNIHALAVEAGGRILVGGDFDYFGPTDYRRRLARLSANGALEPAFAHTPLYAVKAVTVLPDGSLVAGGWYTFTIFNGYPTEHLAYAIRYAADGTALAVQRWAEANSEIRCLAPAASGVILGGVFMQTEGGGPIRHGLCLASSNLEPQPAFAPVVARQATVARLALQSDGQLVVGGKFNLVNGLLRTNLVRINRQGQLDASFQPSGAVAEGAVRKVLLGAGGLIWAAGDRFSCLASNGATLFTTNISALALALQPDGKALVGGMSGSLPAGLQRWQTNGVPDAGFSPGTGVAGALPTGEIEQILDLAVQPDGRILAAGNFRAFNGQPCAQIIRLLVNGTRDNSFAAEPLASSFPAIAPAIYRLLPRPDGKIFAGGYFAGTSNRVANGLALYQDNGALDESWPTNANLGSANLYELALDARGNLLAGGNLQVFSAGYFNNQIVLLGSSGGVDPSLDLSVNSDFYGDPFYPYERQPFVRAILFSATNEVYLAGAFSRLGSAFNPADNLERWSLARVTFTVPMAPVAPTLYWERLSGGDLRIFWPSNQANFTLESAPALGLGTAWQPIAPPATLNGGEWSATVAPAAARQFFRLRYP